MNVPVLSRGKGVRALRIRVKTVAVCDTFAAALALWAEVADGG
jgi:hypothetical protein